MAGRDWQVAALVAALLAATGGLAGCGPAPLSLRDLRAQAAVACTVAAQRSQAILAPRSPAQAAAFIRAGVDSLSVELAALHRIAPTSGSAGEYRQAVGSLRVVVHDLQSASRRLAAGGDPVAVVQTLGRRVAGPRQRANAAWRSLGIARCVS